MRRVRPAAARRRLSILAETVRLLLAIDRRATLVGVATGIAEAVSYPLLLLLLSRVLTIALAGGQQQDASRSLLPGLAIFALLAGQQLVAVLNETAVAVLRAESLQAVNERVLAKLEEIPYRLFEDGEFQARYGVVIREASYRPGTLVESLVGSLVSVLALAGIVATLLAVTPWLAAALLVAVLLTAVETSFRGRTIELQTAAAQDLLRMQFLSQMSVDATWQRDLRAYGSAVLREEYRALGSRYVDGLRRLIRRFQAIRLGAGLAGVGTVAAAIALLLVLARRGALRGSDAAILVPGLYFGLLQARGVATSLGFLVESLGYAEKVLDFLAERFPPVRPAIAGGGGGAGAESLEEVRLDEVTFAYPARAEPALKGVSHVFSRGITAIVGPNGAGKSTLVKLLTGLLEPTSGTIDARSRSGRALELSETRRAVLFQEPSHLYLTVRQNVTLRQARRAGDEAAVVDALRVAGLWDAVRRLPDGIDTVVGPGFGGFSDLSGGQWQRLALARLVFHDAPCIVLDEPVASLDPEGERRLFDLFAEAAATRVVVFTTHRYESIKDSDSIVVLVDGTVTETGTHQDLIERGRDYWALATTQRRPAATGGPLGG